MNKVILVGRMTRDEDIRYTEGENPMAIGRFTLAVDRKIKREGDQTADFINCKAFGKTAEFISKYFSKGRRIGVTGRISTGSYINREGIKVYYTEILVDETEFVDNAPKQDDNTTSPAFDCNIPSDIEEQLPWS